MTLEVQDAQGAPLFIPLFPAIPRYSRGGPRVA